MEIVVQEYLVKHVSVSPRGRVDAFSIPALQSQLDALLHMGVKHFILDLSDVHFMDSAGLAVLVKVLKRVNQIQGSISLILPKEEAARRILRLTHFDQIFDTVETIDAVTCRF